MNDLHLPKDSGDPVREDESRTERAGRDGRFVGSYQNYTGGGISAPLDASYYKGQGSRNGKEREFLAVYNQSAVEVNCMHDQQAVIYPGAQITSKANGNNPKPGDPAPTLSTKCGQDYAVSKSGKQPRKYIVRRLTPTECARLQGFPDWWCDGANGSDSAQYKLWGNGIALPCAEDVIGRCARALREDES